MISVAQTLHEPHWLHVSNKRKHTMNKTLEIAETTTVVSCEAATAVTVTTSPSTQAATPPIKVDQDGPDGAEIKSAIAGRSAEQQKLADIFAQADDQSAAPVADIESVSEQSVPMTAEEIQKLESCEHIIRKGLDTFVEVGVNLAVIRDGGLYRDKYKTFQLYVTERWHFTKQRASQLILAADFRNTLASRNPKALRLTTERATREMMKVPHDRVAEVLDAVLVAGEPTAERIIEEREKIAPKKDAKVTAKKKPAIQIKAAIKAAERWSAFLNACDVKEIPNDQRKALIKTNGEFIKILNKRNPAA
jgi:hypothetical protein